MEEAHVVAARVNGIVGTTFENGLDWIENG